MFDTNSGYVGTSRSVRSQRAIASYEVPITMINKSLVESFLGNDEFVEDFSNEDLAYLKTITISKWKYIAKERMWESSWHHTGKYFQETDHYNLIEIAEKLIELKNVLDEDYRNYLEECRLAKEAETANFKFGVIVVNIWGGTRSHPHITGTEKAAGIVKGDWLYYTYAHRLTTSIRKYKTDSRNVVSFENFDSYTDLVKKHPEYKSTKKIFNRLIKEKIK